MQKGQTVMTILVVAVIAVALYFVFFKPSNTGTQLQEFSNNVLTIENLGADTLAPYSGKRISLDFDLQNNADRTIPEITVNFFDTPGFILDSTSLECTGAKTSDRICKFSNLESLDNAHITLKLDAINVQSPTPFTVSFSVNYTYDGTREAVIPVINSEVRKEPIFKFSQSQLTIGPVTFDIQPQIERETNVDGKTIREYWAVSGNEFTTKFVMSESGRIEGSQPVNIEKGKLIYSLRNMQTVNDKCSHFSSGSSTRPVNKTFNTLICTFTPAGSQSEYTGVISLSYEYSYEFVKKVNFVVQPPI